MKLFSVTCPKCGGKLEVTPNSKIVTCEYCNCDFKLDEEKKRLHLDNAEQVGYEFEKGRQRALQDIEEDKKRALREIEKENKENHKGHDFNVTIPNHEEKNNNIDKLDEEKENKKSVDDKNEVEIKNKKKKKKMQI